MAAGEAEPYVRAADDIRRLAEAHDTALDAFARRVAAGLHGPAGKRIFEQARMQRNALHQAFRQAWDEVATLARRHGGSVGVPPYLASAGLGGYVDGSRRGVDEAALRQAMREAKSRGAALCDAGRGLATTLSRVGANPAAGHRVQELGDWLLGQDLELRRRLQQALAAEAVFDDAFAGLGSGVPTLQERLDRLTESQQGHLSLLYGINRLPPSRERAERTAAWWRSLSPADKNRFIELFPQTIGALDGLPALSRHKANMRVLEADERRLRTRLGSLPRVDPISLDERNRIRDQLAVLKVLRQEAAEANFDANGRPTKDPSERAYLLGLDIDHRKIIFSYGNPDTADNITTFVPGFGTTINSTKANLLRTQDTKIFAERARREQSTASIYWLDYPTPLALDVVTPDNAEDGAPKLGAFQRGLAAAGTKDAHTTLLGHSYGSLTCGKAAVKFPAIADDLVFVGSPGVGVDRATALGVSSEHVWASATDNDIVAGIPPLRWLAVPGGRKHVEEEGIAVFGTDPTHPRFYGRTFDSQAGPSGIGGEHSFAAHSVYWQPHSPSLLNIAHIVVGQDPTENG